MTGKADVVVALSDLADDEVNQLRDIPGLDLIITTGGDAVKPGLDWLFVGFPGSKTAAVARTLSSNTAIHVLKLHGYPDRNKWTVDQIIGEVYEVTKATQRDSATDSWIQWLFDTYVAEENTEIGDLKAGLSNDKGRTRQTELGKAATNLMRARAKTSIAILPSGSLRSDMPKGTITEWDLVESLPSPTNLVVIRLTGEQIADLITKSEGQRGGSGYLQLSGITTEPASLGNRIDGLEILPKHSYTVALSEFLTQGGNGYAELKKAKILERIPTSLQDLCRGALKDASFPVSGRAQRSEANAWYTQFNFDALMNGSVTDPKSLEFYPNEATLARQQMLSGSVESRLALSRRDFYSGFENYATAKYGLAWDSDWVPIQTFNTFEAGSQFTFFLSNMLFGGVKTLDPYVSAIFDTVLFFPGLTDQLVEPTLARPGSIKLAGGVVLTLFKTASLKLGYRWQKQPFRWNLDALTGFEGILAFKIVFFKDILSFDTKTEVFGPFDLPDEGITLSSINNLSFSLKDNLQIVPSFQLFYNTLVGHLAYNFDISIGFSISTY